MHAPQVKMFVLHLGICLRVQGESAGSFTLCAIIVFYYISGYLVIYISSYINIYRFGYIHLAGRKQSKEYRGFTLFFSCFLFTLKVIVAKHVSSVLLCSFSNFAFIFFHLFLLLLFFSVCSCSFPLNILLSALTFYLAGFFLLFSRRNLNRNIIIHEFLEKWFICYKLIFEITGRDMLYIILKVDLAYVGLSLSLWLTVSVYFYVEYQKEKWENRISKYLPSWDLLTLTFIS